ncbi:MAG TPA: glycine cleavage system protein GcvH [Candidatus Kapabacteria bacterium]|nr:glycine cleavage system protein GcvH [Candidatus Kapabacteria bacterium]
MNFPEQIKYAKSHEWLRQDGTTGYVGISDFAQSELGDVVFVDISASVGDELEAGEAFGTIEAVKTVSDLYMPVSGKLLEVNQIIVDKPETINSDPYGDGWMIRIEVTGDASNLLDSSAYSASVGH